MKRLSTALVLTLFLAPSITTGAAVQTADEIVEKHLAAMGGRAALGKLTTRKGVGTVTVATAGGNFSGSVEGFWPMLFAWMSRVTVMRSMA